MVLKLAVMVVQFYRHAETTEYYSLNYMIYELYNKPFKVSQNGGMCLQS